jgi:hypothetical protein
VLSACARHLDASIVMLADTATSVAIKIISGMALGRGASIPLETVFHVTVKRITIEHVILCFRASVMIESKMLLF